MLKVLVTGASGFIGRYVIEELLNNNFEVVATSANPEKAKNLAWLKGVEYKPLKFSAITDDINYQEFFNNPDAIIHLAWEGLPNYKALFHFEDNLPKQYAFLRNLVVNGQRNITVSGTCLEYGMQEGVLDEELPTFPNNSYALAKDTLRKFLEQLQSYYPFSLKWMRLFYMYGEGQNPNSLLVQLSKALENGEPIFNMSGGEQLRDYLPVQLVAAYIVKAAMQHQVTGIINCCSGKPLSVKQFIDNYLADSQQTIKLNTGYYPYNDYEPMSFWGNDRKLKSI